MLDFELEELSLNKNPLVKKMLEHYQDAFLNNPAKKLHIEILRMTEIITSDLGKIGNEEGIDEDGNLISNMMIMGRKELFDQVMTLFKNIPAIQEAIRQGQVASEIIVHDTSEKKMKSRRRVMEGVALK